jgi:hypothetical protein
MRFFKKEVRKRGSMKRRPAPLTTPAPKADGTVLRRWREPEPPIEIIE